MRHHALSISIYGFFVRDWPDLQQVKILVNPTQSSLKAYIPVPQKIKTPRKCTFAKLTFPLPFMLSLRYLVF